MQGTCLRAFAGDDTLYAVSPRNNNLYEIDPESGDVLDSQEILYDDGSFHGMFGLATHPHTGIMYALLSEDERDDPRILVNIDPVNGAALHVGDTGDMFSGLAFGDDGTLYAVIYADEDGELYILDTSDGTPTYLMDILDGHQGVCFNSEDGLLYHLSTYDDVFYTVDPNSLDLDIRQEIYLSTPIGMTHSQDDDLLVAMNNRLYVLTTAGQWTQLGTMDSYSKGLAFDGDGTLGSVYPWNYQNALK